MMYHLCMDIEGALRNKAFKGFTDDDGRDMTPRQVKDRLRYMLAMGHKVLPMGGCNNFDNQKGCLGHKEPDEVENAEGDGI